MFNKETAITSQANSEVSNHTASTALIAFQDISYERELSDSELELVVGGQCFQGFVFPEAGQEIEADSDVTLSFRLL